MVLLHPVQIFVALFSLVVFSIIDIKTLEVHDKFTLSFVIICMIINIGLVMLFKNSLLHILYGTIITLILAKTLVYAKHIGGADYKILLGLAFLTNHEFMIPYLFNMVVVSIPIMIIVRLFYPFIEKIVKLEFTEKDGKVTNIAFPYVPVLLLTFILTYYYDNIIINLIR